ncbi:MAG: uroporphyrinogen-III C-methyltransferase [Bacteroidales bacterium]
MSDKLIIISEDSRLSKKLTTEIIRHLSHIDFRVLLAGNMRNLNGNVALNESREQLPDVRNSINAVLKKEGDIAVLSANALPCPIPEGLTVFILAELEHTKQFEVEKIAINPLDDKVVVIGRTGDRILYHDLSYLDIRKNYGKLVVVGFGPGDPEYLTIKGERALQDADIIFYDDLLDSSYLDNFSCRKVRVGKRKDNHTKSQEEINQLLYNAVTEGKNTVRLKGGDPSIFGRLGEEIRYLRERFVRVEVIPGVTTASAVSAATGIPLTMRAISSSVAFISGHNTENVKIPEADTLVIYMGAHNLDKLCAILISSGKDPETPVVVVSNVSLPGQVVKNGTLSCFCTRQEILTPALIIVSEVINRDEIYQFIHQWQGIHLPHRVISDKANLLT